MVAFNDVFGGSSLQPADVSYAARSLSANLKLDWPALAVSDIALARINELNATVGGLSLTLPDARFNSPGTDAFFTNRGVYAVNLLTFDGAVLAVLAPGAVRYIYLTDNTVAAGVWSTVLFGTSVSQVDASQLAGLGLKAINATLALAPPTTLLGGNTTLTATDRAKTLIWTGGTGILTLPSTASVGTDFVFDVRNQGSGVLTLATTGGETIDASANAQLQLGESFGVRSGTGAWYTIGRGRSTQFSFTQLLKTVVGGQATLSLVEAANVVQTYVGVLTASQIVVLPAVVQVYYVSNQTTGAFDFTFKNPTTGTTVSVPTGQNAVLFSDGINVVNASTTLAGISSLIMAAGSAATPSLAISTSNTGLYSSGTGKLGFSLSGIQTVDVGPGMLKLMGLGSLELGAKSDTASAAVYVDGPSGTLRSAIWRSGGLNRWDLVADNSTEAGANAGSVMKLRAYTDAGATLGDVFTVNRATQVVNFVQPPTGIVNATNAANATNGYFTASAVSPRLEIFKPTVGGAMWTINTANIVALQRTSGLGDFMSQALTIDQVSGNLVASGNVTAFSDERLKRDWVGLNSMFISNLARVKMGTYTRTDTGARQVGVSAQHLQCVLPEAVIADQDGMLSVAYGNAALAACVELAKAVMVLQAEVLQLKAAK